MLEGGRSPLRAQSAPPLPQAPFQPRSHSEGVCGTRRVRGGPYIEAGLWSQGHLPPMRPAAGQGPAPSLSIPAMDAASQEKCARLCAWWVRPLLPQACSHTPFLSLSFPSCKKGDWCLLCREGRASK